MALLASAAALLVAACAPAPSSPTADGPASPAPAGAPAAAAPVTPAPQVRTVRIDYRAGTASGDTGTVSVARGETVRIAVTSDVADEAHLHGYDRTVRLAPGDTGTIDLTADIPGEFELELHGSGAQLATLQVR